MPYIDLGPVVGPPGAQGETGAQGIRGEQGLPGPNQLTNQTATPLTGVLVGSGGVVNVRPIDATPTDNSEGIPTSGGVFNALKTRVPVNGMGKNLLDNWYFLNPVNQRGQSSYTGVVYGIDRWKGAVGYTIADVISGGYRVKSSTGSNTAIIEQTLENPSQLLEKTVSLTILLSSGAYSYSATVPSSFTNTTIINGANVQLVMTSSGFIVVRLITDSSAGVVFVAVKLELGTEQTLCHNEGTAESPVWVLNEIPDYGEELRKCQRYFVRFAKQYGSYIRFGIANAFSNTIAMTEVPLPVTMRTPTATPTVSFSNIYLMNGQTQVPATAITFQGMSANVVYLDITVASGLTQGAMYLVKGDYSSGGSLQTNGYLDISCEL